MNNMFFSKYSLIMIHVRLGVNEPWLRSALYGKKYLEVRYIPRERHVCVEKASSKRTNVHQLSIRSDSSTADFVT